MEIGAAEASIAQQQSVEQAQRAHATELQRVDERLRASEEAKRKAEEDAKAQRESCRRLVALVEQHEQRHKDTLASAEKADLERLQMQRAVSQMADELERLKLESKERVKRTNSKAVRRSTSTLLVQRSGANANARQR